MTRLMLVLGLLSLTTTAVVADLHPRSSQLGTILTTLESDLPACAFRCFSAEPSSTSCDFVADFITSAVTSCLNSNCTTHELLHAEQLITTTCGTEVRNIQASIRGISWTLWAIATIFLSGRLLARASLFNGMRFGPDDWAIIVSWMVLTAVTIGAELMVVFGLGTDMWTLNDTHISVTLVLFYVAEFAYVIESTITKISILLLYLRIFPDPQFRKRCYILVGIMALFCVAFVVTLLTYCVPFDYTWMRWDNERSGKCIDMNAQTYTCASLNIILDAVIFFLPIPQLIKLDLSWKKKVGIVSTFVVGLFVTICSVIRLRALVGWSASTNQTMDYANLAVWSLIELDVGVICACMPGMAGLFRRLKKRSDEYLRSRSSNNASHVLSGGTKLGIPQTITKTTMISVSHRRQGDSTASDSELELVDRSKDANNFNASKEAWDSSH